MADLLTADALRDLSSKAFAAASAEHIQVNLSDTASGTTRFANNQVVQNVDTHRTQLRVSVAFGKRHGSAATTDLSADGIAAMVRRAEEIAKAAPEDPEYLPPLPPQKYPSYATWRRETANAGPQRRMDETERSVKLCAAAGLQAAGIVTTEASAAGVAASSGLFAFERRTRAEFSVTATAPDSTGWTRDVNRSVDGLNVEALTQVAIDKAKLSAKPREIAPGRMTVILEPAALAGFSGALFNGMNAKAYHTGTSALAGKLNTQVIHPRLTLRNNPSHADLTGDGFDGAGLPSDSAVWIERGLLQRLDYDRFTAQEHGQQPSFGLDAPELSLDEPEAESIEALIAATPRAVLVTNFWYIRFVNPRDLTQTGMTRDGTFLVEDGRITAGLVNFRFHDSPLRALKAVSAGTPPGNAVSQETGKLRVPALRIDDFNFSSVTRF